MDAGDVSLVKGKRVHVTLKTCSFLGVVQNINQNKTLVLADVCGTNGCKYPGTKMFFGREIVNIEIVNDRECSSGIGRQQRAERLSTDIRTSTLGDDGDECINFEVIDEFHDKFGSAVMLIKKQHVIGLGVQGFRDGRLFWLQIATKSKVYLFDILLLGAQAFKNGLSMILENKHILKVIHDCRTVSGSLRSQFGVKLTNVFDTQVADVLCFRSRTGGLLPHRLSSLPELLSVYLDVPSSQLLSLRMTSQFTKEEREIWSRRPCPVALQKVLTLSVTHLESLRLELLDSLMKDFMMLVDSFLSSSCYSPDDLDHMDTDSFLELPREFQQLDELYLERQQRAKETFPVTEDDLLDRFNPLVPPSTARGHTGEDSCGPAVLESPDPHRLLESPDPHRVLESPDPHRVLESPDPHRVLESPDPQRVLESPDPHRVLESSNPHRVLESPDPHRVLESPDPHRVLESSNPHRLLESPDPHRVLESPDPHRVLESPDPHRVLESPDPHRVLESPDPHRVLESPNPHRVLESPNPHRVLQSPDPQRVLESPNPHRVLESPDPHRVLESPDPQRVLESPDPQRVLESPNPQRVLESPNPHRVLESPDPQRVLESPDPQRVLESPDPQRVLESPDPHRVLESPNPQRVLESPDPHRVLESPNPQRVLESPDPQRVLESSNPQRVHRDSSTDVLAAADSSPVSGHGARSPGGDAALLMKTMGRGRIFGKNSAPLPGSDPDQGPDGSW